MKKTLHYLNPFARHTPQKYQLCGATDIKIILDTRGIDTDVFGQEELAYNLGSYIDKRDKKTFGTKLRTRALNPGDPRISLMFGDFERPELQGILREKYGLETRVYRPSEIGNENIDKFLCEHIDLNDNVMINFRWDPFRGSKEGHFVLAVAYDEENRELYVADPSPVNPEYWKAKLERFVYAMLPLWKDKDKKKRERGFVVFSGQVHREKDNPEKIELFLKEVPNYKPFRIIPRRKEKSIPTDHMGERIKRTRDLHKIILS